MRGTHKKNLTNAKNVNDFCFLRYGSVNGDDVLGEAQTRLLKTIDCLKVLQKEGNRQLKNEVLFCQSSTAVAQKLEALNCDEIAKACKPFTSDAQSNQYGVGINLEKCLTIEELHRTLIRVDL